MRASAGPRIGERPGARRPRSSRAPKPGRSRAKPKAPLWPPDPSVPPAVAICWERAGGLPSIRRSIAPRKRSEVLARALQAISDPSRIRLLEAIDRLPLCPCLLQRIEPMKNSVLSYHLRILKGAGLVTTSSASNYRIYRATPSGRRVCAFLRSTARRNS